MRPASSGGTATIASRARNAPRPPHDHALGRLLDGTHRAIERSPAAPVVPRAVESCCGAPHKAILLRLPPGIEIRLSSPSSPAQVAREKTSNETSRGSQVSTARRNRIDEQTCSAERRCRRFQVSSVVASHSAARGARQGASGGIAC